jgi:hypothetical protein
VTPVAAKVMESYKDEEMPKGKDSYSEDFDSEFEAFASALKAGKMDAAKRAFKEAVHLCAK